MPPLPEAATWLRATISDNGAVPDLLAAPAMAPLDTGVSLTSVKNGRVPVQRSG